MAFIPIAETIPNYRDFKNQFLKAFIPGDTTTPKLMATDATGLTTVAKFELDKDGFPKTAGGALVIPYIEGAYDLWLFPTAAEADANDTVNAKRFAIDISGSDALFAITKKPIESITLTGGQTTVTFTIINVNKAEINLTSLSGDGRRLLTGTDYTITSVTTIELTNSYPAGTICFADETAVETATFSESDLVKHFDTIALAIAGTKIKKGDVLDIKEYFLGTGGGGTWDVVLTSSVTNNLFDIRVSTDDATLSLVLRIGSVLELDQLGFLGNGSTDNSGVVQRAVDLLSTKQRDIVFPSGNGFFSGITIPTSIQGAIFRGAGPSVTPGTPGTVIRNNNTTTMFSTTGTGTSLSNKFKDIHFKQTAVNSGDIFNITDKIRGWSFENFGYTLVNPASNFFIAVSESVSMLTFRNIQTGVVAIGNTVPAFDIQNNSAAGNIFGVKFEEAFLENNDTSTAPHISMLDNSGGGTSFGNSFDTVIIEKAVSGGGYHLSSIRHPLFTNCVNDDGTVITAPAVLIDTAPAGGSLDPFGATFIDCWFREGDATNPDIKVVPGATGTQVTTIGCNIKFMDTGSKPFVNIGSLITNRVGATDDILLFSGGITIPAGGFFKFQSTIAVPETQTGETGTITAGSFEDVTFPIAFTAAPNVIVSHVGASDRAGEAQASGPTTTTVRVHNFGSVSTTIAWVAVNATTP